MIAEKEFAVFDVLTAMGISFERFEHDAAMTMDDCDLFDQNKAAAHCKNLFLANRQGTRFYLLLVNGEKRFHTKDVSRQLGISRLSFGTDEQLQAVLGLKPGAVSPMGLINDHEHRVHVLLDKDVANWDRLIVHSNVNTASIIISVIDLLRFLSLCKNPVTQISI
ncbi:MAG: prolyl-tRNA synthetase associated domain-containing protein [Clostridiales bacterium]|jgi:Ala-tRNA(Pro) deacylase|nr:prolyl-tRNA synthetase associated domain-containing protein [Clostridiales bacterium]